MQSIVQKLEKTRRSIEAHCARGLALGYNGSVNSRGCELVDRYNDLKDACPHSDWVAYCNAIGAATSHNGYDLFA